MATLSKFGVPGNNGERTGILQPKLQYRFRVLTNNFGPTNDQLDFTQQVISLNKPQLTHDVVTLESYNSRAYVAGKHTWGQITLQMRDDISNNISRLVGHQLQKQVNHFEQTASAAGINYKFDMFIQILDGGNTVVQEEWLCEGCFLEGVDYQALDYGASEQQMISLTVRPDNCTQSGGLMPDPATNFTFLGNDLSG